jgi:hypothetical protein
MAKKAPKKENKDQSKVGLTAAPVPVPMMLWQSEPDNHDYPAAESYLSLLTTADQAKELVARLKKAPVVMHPAKDVLRAAQLELLPMDDAAVKRDVTKVAQGTKLSPVLLMRGDYTRNAPLVIADGYHRVCSSYHLSENELIPCRIIDGTI